MNEQPKAKLSRRDMLKLSAGFAASSLLAACAPVQVPTQPTGGGEEAAGAGPGAEPATGTVTIMHFRHELTEEQEAQFETDTPGIAIEFVEAEQTRFFAMYAAGTPPDLYRLQAPSIPQLLARKLLKDLTPYFEVSELIDIDDLAPANRYYMAEGPLAIGSGKIYGMVKDFSPDLTVFANTALFEEAGLDVPDDTRPLTYDEIMGLSGELTRFEGDRLTQLGYGYEAGWVDRLWMTMLAESDQGLYSEGFDKIVLAGNEAATAVARWYYDMAEQKLTVSPQNPSPSGWFGNDFTGGILGMAQYGFWFSAMAESDDNRGHVMMLPAPTWTGQRLDPTITATGMIMTSATQVPDAAWKVFEWYNAGGPSIARAKSGWGVPALKSQWQLIPKETDFQQQANKVLEGELALDSPPIQFNPFIGETVVADSWAKNLDLALTGNITFDELLANVESEVNLAISEGIDRILG